MDDWKVPYSRDDLINTGGGAEKVGAEKTKKSDQSVVLLSWQDGGGQPHRRKRGRFFRMSKQLGDHFREEIKNINTRI